MMGIKRSFTFDFLIAETTVSEYWSSKILQILHALLCTPKLFLLVLVYLFTKTNWCNKLSKSVLFNK